MSPAVLRTLALALCAACGGRTPTPPAAPPIPAPPPAATTIITATPAPEPAVAPPDVSLGAAAPTLVQAVAPDGRWVVLCQARADTDGDGRLGASIGMHGEPLGDALVPYLIEGSGLGVEIDDFLAADPSGRHVLLLSHNQLVLRDTTTSSDTPLIGEPSPVAFTDDGEKLVYVRRRAPARVDVVVRTLATGDEHAVDPGAGEPVAVELYPQMRALRVVARLPDPGGDTNTVRTNLYRGRCAGGAASSSHWGISRAVYEQRIISLTSPRLRVVPGELRRFLYGWLRTLADGSMRLESMHAKPADAPSFAERTCGKVLFVDPVRGRLVAACPRGSGVELRLFAAGAPTRSIATLEAREFGELVEPFGRHLLLTARDADDLIIDVQTGKRRQAATYQRLIAIRGDTTLVQRGEQLVLLDGPGERVLGSITRYPRIFGVRDRTTREPERLLLVDTWAVDMSRGAFVGVVPDEPPVLVGGLPMGTMKHRPFGFTTDGRVLVESPPATGARIVSEIASGPMRWVQLVPLAR